MRRANERSNELTKLPARKCIASAFEKVGDLLGYVAGAIIMLLAIPVVYSAAARDVGYPTDWGFEITIYALITGAFLANAQAFKHGSHFRVKILIARFPHARLYVDAVAWVATFAFGAIIFMSGCLLSIYSYVNDIHAPSLLDTPLFIPQAAFPLGGLGLMLQSLAQLLDPSGCEATSHAHDDAEQVYPQ